MFGKWSWAKIFPLLQCLQGYGRHLFVRDLIAATVVTALLIPQSLAYAMLAGVPVEVGLYASILPLVLYALFGSSRTLSVGPVAIVSLLTASVLADLVQQGEVNLLTGVASLAFLSGVIQLAMGLLRAGFLASFLSHSVVSGFMSASSIIIIISQLKYIFGISASGGSLLQTAPTLLANISQTNVYTFIVGSCAIVFLVIAKKYAQPFFSRLGCSAKLALALAKMAPVAGVIVSILVVSVFNLHEQGVAITGNIPSGLPSFSIALPSLSLLEQLFLPALLISLVGYVGSISVGKTLANRRGEKIDPNQELIGLGIANLGSFSCGGLAVTGGFSRTIVNYDAGAATQIASIMAALGIALATKYLTPFLYYLPKAMLAATIIAAIYSLIDYKTLKQTWQYDKRDFGAVFMTIVLTLIFGVEVGVAAGVLLSLVLYIHKTSNPHMVEVGLVEGSEHFRNIRRHHVRRSLGLVSIRIDESLFFGNTPKIESYIFERLRNSEQTQHLVLMCSAVNDIDYSALETLVMLNQQLKEQGVTLHLSEVKGPVMDKLERSGFVHKLSGELFFTQYEAFKSIEHRLKEANTGKYLNLDGI